MPQNQLCCCQSAAIVPLPQLPQAQPETRAPPCRQSPSRSSHRFGATLPRTASCDFDLPDLWSTIIDTNLERQSILSRDQKMLTCSYPVAASTEVRIISLAKGP